MNISGLSLVLRIWIQNIGFIVNIFYFLAELQLEDPVITLNLLSNGMEFYWIRLVQEAVAGDECGARSNTSYSAE